MKLKSCASLDSLAEQPEIDAENVPSARAVVHADNQLLRDTNEVDRSVAHVQVEPEQHDQAGNPAEDTDDDDAINGANVTTEPRSASDRFRTIK